MDRETFLKIAGSAIVAGPASVLLDGCSTPYVVYATAVGKTVSIPVSTLPDLAVPNSVVKVYVEGFANPLHLFEDEEGKLRAILSTCSHSGCEVRKLRAKFECPCHGSEYDLRGQVLRGPAPDPLDAFEVRQRDAVLEILLG